MMVKLLWDKNKPDGTPRKLMDSSKLNSMGFFSKISLKNGITNVYNDLEFKGHEIINKNIMDNFFSPFCFY